MPYSDPVSNGKNFSHHTAASFGNLDLETKQKEDKEDSFVKIERMLQPQSFKVNGEYTSESKSANFKSNSTKQFISVASIKPIDEIPTKQPKAVMIEQQMDSSLEFKER